MWFGCSVSDISFRHHIDYCLFDAFESMAHQALDNNLDEDGFLSAESIMEAYFPLIEADVFISHSHKDLAFAKDLAGFLYDSFGLISFIDSMAWGYSDELLHKIDDEYCWQPLSETYSYQKRNLSTSYVHMMLSVALANMIDKCTCFLFIDSEQSIKPSDIRKKKETFSPWIFHELAFFHKVKKHKKAQINFSLKKKASVADHIALESFMSFPANTDELKVFDHELINEWIKIHSSEADAIEELFELLHPTLNE